METRRPSVAGMFYPGNPNQLTQLLRDFFSRVSRGGRSLGVVAPHAGYIYSGKIAASSYAAFDTDFQGTFIVIGPSHSGYSTCVSAERWETPLGIIEPDQDLISLLDIDTDEYSHQREHSIEVQIPFIQYAFPGARVVPIMMGNQSLDAALRLAEKISWAIRQTDGDVRLVASSDFSHYIPDERARKQDIFAIDALKTLDLNEFYRRIRAEGVSACGYGPIATMVTVCREMGAERGELLDYATSGDVTGDRSEVVGYAAIAVI
jgi:AmmeMemoRadiSam system protein B